MVAEKKIIQYVSEKNDDMQQEKQYKESRERKVIPVWKRYALTITEAANYYHIGEAKLRILVDNHPDADFAIQNGNRILIKRKKFEQFLDEATVL